MSEPIDAVRLALRAGGQSVRFKAGDRLFAPGDWPGSWVAIERGRVRVSLLAPSGREVTLYRIGAGEFLPAHNILADRRRALARRRLRRNGRRSPHRSQGDFRASRRGRSGLPARCLAQLCKPRRRPCRHHAGCALPRHPGTARASAPRPRKARNCRGDASGNRERTRQRARGRVPCASKISSARASSRSNGGGSSFAIPTRCGECPRPNSDQVTDDEVVCPHSLV